MPTARELLEQADALMRRNRAAVDDDIPVLTDAVPSVHEAQSRFVPTSRQMSDAPAPPVVDSDVPVLTDAVEEIEAAALLPAVGEGEPSDWLDMEDGEPSVIGDAPDSIAIVPPVILRQAEPTPVIDEFDGLDEELAAAIAASPREEESLQPSPAAMAPSEPLSVPFADPLIAPAVIAGGAAALLQRTEPPRSEIAAPAAPDVYASPAPPAAPEVIEMTEVSDWPEVPAAPEVIGVLEMREVPEAPAAPEVNEPLDVPETPEVPAAPNLLDDAAHWEAIAEEIRMQVLQRIDLFTDTGLRTQLGERLQPIVDRASADLVATINTHVGELLRAYVAEAIEREIDSWRRNH